MPRERLLRNYKPGFVGRKAQRQRVDQRAISRSPENREFAAVYAEAKQMAPELDETATKWNSALANYPIATELIFSQEAPINRFLSVRRKVPALIQKANMVNSGQRNIELTRSFMEGVFDHEVAGVSLFDIEKMGYPLSLDELKSLTEMFGVNKIAAKFGRANSKERLILETLIAFACQNKLDADGANVPRDLRALYVRITDFLDYHTGLLLDPDLTEEEQERSIVWFFKGLPYVPIAISAYIPASIGISPASTMKALHQRLEEMHSMGHKILFRKLEKFVAKAHRKGAIPENLEQYLQYTPESDRVAEQYIEGYYKSLSKDEGKDAHKTHIELIDKAAPYFRKIAARLRRDPAHPLTFEVPANRMVQDVTVTSQDRRTLIFIVKFTDGKTHLTLELTEKGDYFGFPPVLMVNNEIAAAAFMRDMLTPYLSMVREMHPEVTEAPKQVFIEEGIEVQVLEGEQTKEPQKKRSFKRIFAPVARLVGKKEDVEMVQRTGSGARQFVVVSSRNQVETMMGTNAKPKSVDGIMQLIKDFEHGRKTGSALDVEGQSALYMDGWKVVLSNSGGKYYYLEDVSTVK